MTEDTLRLASLQAATANSPNKPVAHDRTTTATAPLVDPRPVSAPTQHNVETAAAAIAQQIQSYLQSVGRSLQFSVDNASGETVVTVRDAQTGEVVRQIPGEETLRLARTLGSQSSALVDLLA